LNEVWDKRRAFGLYDAIIRNCDETPIFFIMTANKIIAQKGGKTIIIKTQEQEKYSYNYIILTKKKVDFLYLIKLLVI